MEMSTLEHVEHAFENFRAGSQGFCAYIETNTGLDMTREEIERICTVAPNASKFMSVWRDADWWTDDNNA